MFNHYFPRFISFKAFKLVTMNVSRCLVKRLQLLL